MILKPEEVKKLFLFLLWLTALGSQVQAQTAENDTEQQIAQLKGEWKIDLRPTPTAEAYYQTFIVSKVNGNRFKGTFYGSKIKEGLINQNWDQLYFAFSTSDGSNEYYHSGYLKDGKLIGISYCPGREFTAPWSGLKQ